MSDDKKGKTPPSLSESDIETSRGVSRRKMLRGFGMGTVVGAAGLGLSGCVVVSAPGIATGITDADNGPITDPGGAGRGGRRSVATGITDADNGPIVDPGGFGRGGGGGVINTGGTGITDADNGPIVDPGGRGRGGRRGYFTGFTDADNGPIVDPGGQGRGPRR